MKKQKLQSLGKKIIQIAKQQIVQARNITEKMLAVVVIFIGISLFTFGNAQSGILDMFSFFNIGSNSRTTTIVAPIVGAELKPENGMPPVVQAPALSMLRCRHMRYEGKFPHLQFYPADHLGANDAFLIDGENATLAFINRPFPDNRFELWVMNPANLNPIQNINIGWLHPGQDKWKRYYVSDVACLTNDRLLIAVGYRDPYAKNAIFLYGISDATFSMIADVDSNAQSGKYFEYKQLANGATLVMYFTDMRRQSAEIYFNYYNHIILIKPENKNSMDILKLGIDIGNVKEWSVVNNTLFMKTLDARKQKNKEMFWSLSLAKLLRNL